jgi:uncharacterized protein YjbJ (UPF0337 family)
MDKNDKDKFEGFAEEKKGDVKEGVGNLRGDENQEAEGQADQVSGKVKKGVADVKGKVQDAVDDIKK